MMRVKSVEPLYGVNYDLGYIFFTFVGGPMSSGIAYFERWARVSDIKVSHTGVVTGRDECVEAHWKLGVQRSDLAKYFDSKQAQIFFRRPALWTPRQGAFIAQAARRKIGSKYNRGLILAQLLANTAAGHLVNRCFGGRPNQWVARQLDAKGKFICSQLSAYALNQQEEYRGLGCLAKPLNTIAPQELFEDEVLFAPWDIQGQKAEREAIA